MNKSYIVSGASNPLRTSWSARSALRFSKGVRRRSRSIRSSARSSARTCVTKGVIMNIKADTTNHDRRRQSSTEESTSSSLPRATARCGTPKHSKDTSSRKRARRRSRGEEREILVVVRVLFVLHITIHKVVLVKILLIIQPRLPHFYSGLSNGPSSFMLGT